MSFAHNFSKSRLGPDPSGRIPSNSAVKFQSLISEVGMSWWFDLNPGSDRTLTIQTIAQTFARLGPCSAEAKYHV